MNTNIQICVSTKSTTYGRASKWAIMSTNCNYHFEELVEGEILDRTLNLYYALWEVNIVSLLLLFVVCNIIRNYCYMLGNHYYTNIEYGKDIRSF